MIRLEEERLKEIMQAGNQKRIIVFGDLMVDRYLWGNVSRISPEAPVPIINIDDEEIRFGGAGNVANNLIGLGAIPLIVGVVGNDNLGKAFRSMLLERNLSDKGLIVDAQRPTTVKTRIIGNNQHIARVDREKLTAIDRQTQDQILDHLGHIIDDANAIIIQDYNKGVVAAELIQRIIQLANERQKIVTADPKFDNFWEFKGVTVFKPNKKEAEAALAARIQTDQELVNAGGELLKKIDGEAVLITRGRDGMALFERDSAHTFIKTSARKVADVSGAGDTVIAALTFALAAAAAMKEAVTIANYAAGLVCEEVGVVPVNGEKLVESIVKNQEC